MWALDSWRISVHCESLAKRIIACLDVHGGRVVKGIQFVQLRDAGDPAELAGAHSEAGADEIVLLDITATSELRNTLLETVRRTAKPAVYPFHRWRRHPFAPTMQRRCSTADATRSRSTRLRSAIPS